MIAADAVDPELSLDLLVAILDRARLDARRDREARRFLDEVARRAMAEAGGARASAADVAWAALAVMWERRGGHPRG